MLGRVAWNVKGLIDEQICDRRSTPKSTALPSNIRSGGIRRLVFVVEQRMRQPGASLYLVTNFAGETITGNIADLQPGLLNRPGITETSYRRSGDTDGRTHAHWRVFLFFRAVFGWLSDVISATAKHCATSWPVRS